MRGILLRHLLAALFLIPAGALADADAAEPKLDAEGRIDCEFLRAHHSFLERAKDARIRLLFLGDSITNGWFWGEHRQLWDLYFGRYDAANFGIGGDRTEHLLWRIENGELDRVRPRAAGDPARAKIREINRGLAQLQGDDVRFLDIGDRFTAADGTLPKEIMPDALHLSFKGYQIWAEALAPLIEEMMR